MADAIVSTILGQLASILYQRGDEEVRLLAGVEEGVERLNSNFQAIKSVLEDAECKQVKDKAVGDWLDKLREVSYKVEDVLDEWNTTIQQRRIMEADENASKLMRKVRSLISGYGCCGWQVVLRHNFARKIKELNEALGVIAMEKKNFHFLNSVQGLVEVERQITTSVVDITEIHGRDDDKKEIKNLLLSESSNQPISLPIISLVGLGGIGKTTLARLVFNDHEVITHFHKNIWVCVSDPFDEIRIGKAILESLQDVAPNVNEYQSVLGRIQESIKDKKFLLVLDDVWTEDSNKWEQLKTSLKHGAKGSRILVTTRKENVAKVMGTTSMIHLRTLLDENGWSLFSQVAFSGRSNEEQEKLENIGRKIVGKCKGLPLSIKVLGSLLHSKRKIEEWQSVLDNEMWELEEVEKGIFPPLLLSYFDLPSELKRCFLYCAIFPKDYEIEKEQLIQLWMAHDYLRPNQNKDMELVGEEYFERLAMRSFFQDFEKFEDEIISCKMHDMVHDLVQYITRNECFNVEVDNMEEFMLNSGYGRARHARIVLKGEASFPISKFDDKNRLRSFILIGERYFMEKPMFIDTCELFDKYTSLRVLELNYKLLKDVSSGINKLIHLRYLNISNNYEIEELPEATCELYNLQMLDISRCQNLNKLPEGIGKLVNLRYLINFGSFNECIYMPKGIERLTCLRRLDQVVVSGDKKACKFECLRNLNHLGGYLEMKGTRLNVGEINKAELKNKTQLIELRLELSSDVSNEEAVEDMQPPPNLVKLTLQGYGGGNLLSRNWLESLTKLKYLILLNWSGSECLCLGKLPCLELLRIEKTKSLKRLGDEILGMESNKTSSSSVIAFPKLQSLTFWNMEDWEEWDCGTCGRGGEEFKIMPCLRSLTIYRCPKLKTLPDYILQSTTLEELEIYRCPILGGRYRVEKAENWVEDSGIPKIRIYENYEISIDSA